MGAFAAFVACAIALVLGGCRRPDPVYDRTPRPIATRDLVRAERRSATVLDAAGRQALREAHDRYLAAFEVFRTSELEPFAAELRSAPPDQIAADPKRLRSFVGRHRGLMSRIASLDDAFLDDLRASLGDARADFIERLRSRRSIDRASALSFGDGGRGLLDLRQLLDAFDLDESERAMVEPTLRDFDREAASLASSIADAQANLPLEHLQVLERRGPPERDVDPRLKDDARKKAFEAAELERYAEARKTLEILLERYADLVDRTAEGVSVVLDDDESARFRRRLLQSRSDDDAARLGDPSSFMALVAARALAVPKDVRERIEAMRTTFLAEDEGRLRDILAIRRSAHEPGVFDPIGKRDGPDGRKAQKEREAAASKARVEAAKRFRDQVLEMLPAEVRSQIDALRETSREEFADRLAEIVGSGPASTILRMKPQGIGDGDPPDPFQVPAEPSSQDPGELRSLITQPPDGASVRRLVLRSGIDGTSGVLVEQVVAGWRPRWEATRDPARQKVREMMQPIMAAMNQGDGRAFETAVQRLFSVIDGLRDERRRLDDDLLAEIVAALPVELSPAASDLWRWERNEASMRLRWGDLPFSDELRIPAEVAIPFIETIGRAPVPDARAAERAAVVAAALEPFIADLDQATEALRDAILTGVRKTVALTIEGRKAGLSEREAVRGDRPEVKRIRAPIEETAERLCDLRLSALAAVVAALPRAEGRELREYVVRSMYPRLLAERRTAERALRRLSEEPLLDDTRRGELALIMEERGRARDAALDRLLDWTMDLRRSPSPDRGDADGRETASRRHPRLAAVLFDREEADARAVLATWDLLDEAIRTRHRDLESYFNDPPASVRWLD